MGKKKVKVMGFNPLLHQIEKANSKEKLDELKTELAIFLQAEEKPQPDKDALLEAFKLRSTFIQSRDWIRRIKTLDELRAARDLLSKEDSNVVSLLQAPLEHRQQYLEYRTKVLAAESLLNLPEHPRPVQMTAEESLEIKKIISQQRTFWEVSRLLEESILAGTTPEEFSTKFKIQTILPQPVKQRQLRALEGVFKELMQDQNYVQQLNEKRSQFLSARQSATPVSDSSTSVSPVTTISASSTQSPEPTPAGDKNISPSSERVQDAPTITTTSNSDLSSSATISESSSASISTTSATNPVQTEPIISPTAATASSSFVTESPSQAKPLETFTQARDSFDSKMKIIEQKKALIIEAREQLQLAAPEALMLALQTFDGTFREADAIVQQQLTDANFDLVNMQKLASWAQAVTVRGYETQIANVTKEWGQDGQLTEPRRRIPQPISSSSQSATVEQARTAEPLEPPKPPETPREPSSSSSTTIPEVMTPIEDYFSAQTRASTRIPSTPVSPVSIAQDEPKNLEIAVKESDIEIHIQALINIISTKLPNLVKNISPQDSETYPYRKRYEELLKTDDSQTKVNELASLLLQMNMHIVNTEQEIQESKYRADTTEEIQFEVKRIKKADAENLLLDPLTPSSSSDLAPPTVKMDSPPPTPSPVSASSSAQVEPPHPLTELKKYIVGHHYSIEDINVLRTDTWVIVFKEPRLTVQDLFNQLKPSEINELRAFTSKHNRITSTMENQGLSPEDRLRAIDGIIGEMDTDPFFKPLAKVAIASHLRKIESIIAPEIIQSIRKYCWETPEPADRDAIKQAVAKLPPRPSTSSERSPASLTSSSPIPNASPQPKTGTGHTATSTTTKDKSVSSESSESRASELYHTAGSSTASGRSSADSSSNFSSLGSSTEQPPKKPHSPGFFRRWFRNPFKSSSPEKKPDAEFEVGEVIHATPREQAISSPSSGSLSSLSGELSALSAEPQKIQLTQEERLKITGDIHSAKLTSAELSLMEQGLKKGQFIFIKQVKDHPEWLKFDKDPNEPPADLGAFSEADRKTIAKATDELLALTKLKEFIAKDYPGPITPERLLKQDAPIGGYAVTVMESPLRDDLIGFCTRHAEILSTNQLLKSPSVDDHLTAIYKIIDLMETDPILTEMGMKLIKDTHLKILMADEFFKELDPRGGLINEYLNNPNNQEKRAQIRIAAVAHEFGNVTKRLDEVIRAGITIPPAQSKDELRRLQRLYEKLDFDSLDFDTKVKYAKKFEELSDYLTTTKSAKRREYLQKISLAPAPLAKAEKNDLLDKIYKLKLSPEVLERLEKKKADRLIFVKRTDDDQLVFDMDSSIATDTINPSDSRDINVAINQVIAFTKLKEFIVNSGEKFTPESLLKSTAVVKGSKISLLAGYVYRPPLHKDLTDFCEKHAKMISDLEAADTVEKHIIAIDRLIRGREGDPILDKFANNIVQQHLDKIIALEPKHDLIRHIREYLSDSDDYEEDSLSIIEIEKAAAIIEFDSLANELATNLRVGNEISKPQRQEYLSKLRNLHERLSRMKLIDNTADPESDEFVRYQQYDRLKLYLEETKTADIKYFSKEILENYPLVLAPLIGGIESADGTPLGQDETARIIQRIKLMSPASRESLSIRLNKATFDEVLQSFGLPSGSGTQRERHAISLEVQKVISLAILKRHIVDSRAELTPNDLALSTYECPSPIPGQSTKVSELTRLVIQDEDLRAQLRQFCEKHSKILEFSGQISADNPSDSLKAIGNMILIMHDEPFLYDSGSISGFHASISSKLGASSSESDISLSKAIESYLAPPSAENNPEVVLATIRRLATETPLEPDLSSVAAPKAPQQPKKSLSDRVPKINLFGKKRPSSEPVASPLMAAPDSSPSSSLSSSSVFSSASSAPPTLSRSATMPLPSSTPLAHSASSSALISPPPVASPAPTPPARNSRWFGNGSRPQYFGKAKPSIRKGTSFEDFPPNTTMMFSSVIPLSECDQALALREFDQSYAALKTELERGSQILHQYPVSYDLEGHGVFSSKYSPDRRFDMARSRFMKAYQKLLEAGIENTDGRKTLFETVQHIDKELAIKAQEAGKPKAAGVPPFDARAAYSSILPASSPLPPPLALNNHHAGHRQMVALDDFDKNLKKLYEARHKKADEFDRLPQWRGLYTAEQLKEAKRRYIRNATGPEQKAVLASIEALDRDGTRVKRESQIKTLWQQGGLGGVVLDRTQNYEGQVFTRERYSGDSASYRAPLTPALPSGVAVSSGPSQRKSLVADDATKAVERGLVTGEKYMSTSTFKNGSAVAAVTLELDHHGTVTDMTTDVDHAKLTSEQKDQVALEQLQIILSTHPTSLCIEGEPVEQARRVYEMFKYMQKESPNSFLTRIEILKPIPAGNIQITNSGQELAKKVCKQMIGERQLLSDIESPTQQIEALEKLKLANKATRLAKMLTGTPLTKKGIEKELVEKQRELKEKHEELNKEREREAKEKAELDAKHAASGGGPHGPPP